MKGHLILTVCLFAYLIPLKAQNPVAAFSASPISGCAPLTVTFRDESTGNPIFWNWEFGNGDLSTAQNPTATFSQPGTYTVRLVVRNANGTDGITRTDYITVLPSPSASFTADRTVSCLPASIQFTDQSTSSSGTINSWSWNFGDGSPNSTAQHPSHNYTSSGFYTILLTITSTSGCASSASIGRYIRVVSGVTADFDYTTDARCIAPFTANFTNQTSGPGTLSYIWRFHDGTNSTTENATHSYPATGSYDVKLVANSDLGCSDSIVKTVTINGANVQFNAPPTACINSPVNFQNTSAAGATSFSWNFGDGNTSTATNPVYTYTTPGTYTVSLTGNYPFCSSTVTQTIVVAGTDFVFNADPVNACQAPLTVDFTTNSSVGGWQWNFGDGNTSTDQNPTHTYTTPGHYNVSLTVPGSGGCSKTLLKTNYISIASPSIILNNAVAGCAPFTYSPIANNNIIVDAIDGIASYSWDWGDGSPIDNSNTNTHIYMTNGVTYNVTLTITTTDGCTITQILPNAVRTGISSSGNFTTTVPNCLEPLTINFTSVSGVGALPTYNWDFGDGTPSSSDPNPGHTYAGPGTYTVTLVMTDENGCSSTITKNVIVADPNAIPHPAFTVSDSVSVCQLFETKFTFQGTGHTSYSWDFGDGSTSTLQNPTHFYNDYGTYIAKLYLTNASGCTDSAQRTIQVVQPNSSMISYPPPYERCNEITIDFTLTPPPSTSFTFYFGDGQSDNTQATFLQHYYGSPSTYNPSMVITDKGGCIASAGGANTIRVIGAEPFYSQDRRAFCDNGDVTFTNFIISNDGDPAYLWDFGDGTTSSTDANPVHTYLVPGVYPTSLTVTTQSGCEKTLYDTVRVYRTPAPSIVADDIACINDIKTLQGVLAVLDTAITWQWNLTGGQTSDQQNTSITFQTVGDYTISLQATNLLNCSASVSKQITAVTRPDINLAIDPVVITVTNGIPMPITYSNNVTSYTWTPADGLSCTDCAIPFVNPQFTKTYKIDVTDANGCIASRDVLVKVICNENNYFIPNTFSPNGDGVNDIFYPRGKGVYSVPSMRIFNRWGELVYEKKNFSSNDPAAGWNGYYKGKPANADVYLYIVEVVCENAQIIPLKGNVTLIR